MLVDGRAYRSIWLDEGSGLPRVIDQTRLPFAFELRTLATVADAAEAIAVMRVRGAPLIGATAAHGLALALAVDSSDAGLSRAIRTLASTRPTAINLRWALERVERVVAPLPSAERAARARAEAIAICDDDVATCSAIGDHGAALLERLSAARPARPLQILTHCNAGWLATVDWGTALAPIYKAHARGLPLHVWVDETRPRNQGAALMAFELREYGIPHTVVADNAGGHLMQRGQVDLVLVGSDRTTSTGDVCNKIGTYLKALAAHAHGIPFYVALPLSTIDWSIADGLREIPIEERSAEEVRTISGRRADGRIERIELFGAESAAANPAFDVTPAALVTGLVTERGIVAATAETLATLRSGP
ncbi:S-methyl-5-thioribose-1-phosphate isomerase [Myxococcota bacterium]|nr:S-methyl-5-thioribose-1-phosphate isomerase [Myxococcota bacterium]